MIEVVEFNPAHAAALEVQDAQRVDAACLGGEYGMAFTAMADGRPVACAGVLEVWAGRGYAWALLGRDCGSYFLAIHRAVNRGIVLCGLRRVEMAVDAGFLPGIRWAQLLGFKLETPEPMRAFLPNGRDAYLYARVQ